MNIVIIALAACILIAGCVVYAYVNRLQEVVPVKIEERPPQPVESTEYVYELY